MTKILSKDSSSGSNLICPECGGSGSIIWLEIVPEYDKKTAVWLGKPCPRCRGRLRAGDALGIPENFSEADLSKFDFEIYGCNLNKFEVIVRSFVDNFERWRENGLGLYFSSRTPGSGKTFLASCVLRSIVLKYGISGRFVSTPDYLTAVGDSYKRQTGTEDPSAIYRKCDLLVVDDVGSQKAGSWQDSEIFRLVDGRLRAGLVTIFTSNVCQRELDLPDRTISRIEACSIPLLLPEVSIRQRQTEERRAAVLKRILGEAS
ncbi:MAG: ATP-binding protein [Clostridiales bacterium]|nr:ATP-binding protein [Clostridiales bacterium]